MAAGLGAALAMFVVGFPAFGRAGVADFRAERAQAGVKFRTAAYEPSHGPTNVGAVDAEPRALFPDSETLVAAVLAFLSASHAGVDAVLMFVMCHIFLLSS
jgi:hypothetical protein